jgi:hypothetical protein
MNKPPIDSGCACLTIPLSSPNRRFIATTQGYRESRRSCVEPVEPVEPFVAAAQLRDEDK